jgi:hypothetical protein
VIRGAIYGLGALAGSVADCLLLASGEPSGAAAADRDCSDLANRQRRNASSSTTTREGIQTSLTAMGMARPARRARPGPSAISL